MCTVYKIGGKSVFLSLWLLLWRSCCHILFCVISAILHNWETTVLYDFPNTLIQMLRSSQIDSWKKAATLMLYIRTQFLISLCLCATSNTWVNAILYKSDPNHFDRYKFNTGYPLIFPCDLITMFSLIIMWVKICLLSLSNIINDFQFNFMYVCA